MRGTVVKLRVIAVPVALGLGVASLSACSPSLLGAAAVVDSSRITVSEIQGSLSSAHALQVRYGVTPADSTSGARDEVQRRVVDLIFDRAASSLGVTVSAGEVSSAITASRKQLGGDAGLGREFARANLSLDEANDVFRQQLLNKKMIDKLTAANPGATSDAINTKLLGSLVTAAKSMRIRINPRYGRFNAEAGQIDPVPFDFLRDST
jgi:hypothetical protein